MLTDPSFTAVRNILSPHGVAPTCRGATGHRRHGDVLTDQSTFPFRGPAPDRDTVVLDQATTVSLAAWQAALPPEWLPLAFRAQDSRKVVVRRRDVFALAEHAHTPVGAMHTYVAAAAWGSRPGREVSRRLAAFGDVGAVAVKLAAVTNILATGGAVAGFTALRGEHRIAHVGPAFGTKFLYFAGYRRVPSELQPLILDKNTGVAVQRLTGAPCPYLDVSTADYTSYLRRLHRWAEDWGGCEPDVVERAVFDVGRAPRLAVHVLSGVPDP
ncbi:8-oxoguanine DNA glycosylase OGG fold protein [Geodermatophilus sp. SYSU D00700]